MLFAGGMIERAEGYDATMDTLVGILMGCMEGMV